MCELFCLCSRVPTRATLSLQRFAEHGGYGHSAIDGWGLAFYDGPDVRLYKEPEPAANSPWISFIEERDLPTRLLVSHIRHATRGALSHANTHPFMRELGGRQHVFAHNGRLDEIGTRYAGVWQRFRPIGETDSEIAFCILLERMAPLWSGRGFLRCKRGLPSLHALRTRCVRSGRPISFMPTATFFLRTGTGAHKSTARLPRPGFGISNADAHAMPMRFPRPKMPLRKPPSRNSFLSRAFR